MTNQWLCIIDVKNEQEDYASCTQTIRTIELLESDVTLEKPKDIFPFRIMRRSNGVTTSKHQIVEIENILSAGHSHQVRQIKSWKQLCDGLQKSGGQNHFSYYIRIDLSGADSDLPTLRYLLLLIQSCPSIEGKLMVFLRCVGASASKQTELYFKISHFLRFVQSHYQIFFGEFDNTIASLSTKQQGIQQTFVPLLEIDEKTYSVLGEPCFLYSDYRPGQSYATLYKALVPLSENQDTYRDELYQIGTRFLFRSINGRKYQTEEKKRQLLMLITKVVEEFAGVSPLDMLLFGSLMGESMHEGLAYEQVKGYLSEIKAFSYAVAQILENICRHSEYHKGAFTIRLQTMPEYISKNYPGYQIAEKEYGLELLIADSNFHDGIIRHFLNSNKATDDLRMHKNLINLADFFQENPMSDAAPQWRRARTERPGHCHGLLSFSRAVCNFGGAFYVRSGSAFTDINRRNYYYYRSGSDTASIGTFHSGGYWFPGTQFSAVFKRVAFHKSLEAQRKTTTQSVLDAPHIIYSTTYRDLAQSLRFRHVLQPFFSSEETAAQLSKNFSRDCGGLRGQEKKDRVAEKWRRWFSQRAAACKLTAAKADNKPEYFLFYAELRDFGSGQECFPGEFEAFCKGFLSSAFFRRSADRESVRYAILFTDLSARIGVSFYQTLSVLFRRIDTSAICVYFYQANESDQTMPYFSATLQETLHRIDESQPTDVPEFPRTFPYLLLMENEGMGSIFEYEMARQATISILEPDQQGYMIEDTHMRLGNKVHLDSFFEMALFFENPNYAYYTAFLILRRIIEQPALRKKLENASHILFYGYSSYSRSVVWAAIQIWQEYIELEGLKPPRGIEFAIYQNDLKLESSHPNVQMYYSHRDWQKNPQKIWPAKDTTLLQIVPISSSLTTFNKMLAELRDESKQAFDPLANLTALWVRDDYREKLPKRDWNFKPTDEEKSFWDLANLKERWVESNSLGIRVQYLVSVTSYWRNPLKCKKCFPSDPVLEFPLVETDPTSTVPTQQFYLRSDKRPYKQIVDAEIENDSRVAKIRGNLLYGHIARGHNHFQFYLQTRRYFQQEREAIKEWLRGLSEKKECDIHNALKRGIPPKRHIDVMVVPKQTSNVEFSQYVYEYYLRSSAESIVVNTEKEFRSNFLAEYNGLAIRLRREQEAGCEIRLHYVDTAIDSGLTFQRATALLSSLFERHQILRASEPNALFENVFLLISRMSYASKQAYVQNPTEHFHAFVELYISNMRSFGDSCVPCKLQQEAHRYYQNAATKSISAYWEIKSIQRASIPFDDADLRKRSSEESYRRMACTHRATYYFSHVRGKEVSDYFGALRAFFTELQRAANREDNVSPVYQRLSTGEDSSLQWFSAALKIMVRPFFSFDYKLRCAVMDFYLLLSENLLRPEQGGLSAELLEKEKPYLLEEGILEWVSGFAQDITSALESSSGSEQRTYRWLSFIQAHLLKGLTDLKSNYPLRYCTICAVFQRISEADLTQKEQEDFLQHYLRSILRLVNNSSDETKSIWLEYLLQSHYEYPANSEEHIPGKTLYDEIPENMHGSLRYFLEVLLVENNRPLFQGVRDLAHTLEHHEDAELGKTLNASYMRNVRQFLDMGLGGQPSDGQTAENELKPLAELYQMLRPPKIFGVSEEVGKDVYPLKRYDDLRKAFEKIVSETAEDGVARVVLFGPRNLKSPQPNPSAYYMISPPPPIDYADQEKVEKDLIHLESRLIGHEKELDAEGFSLVKSKQDSEKYDVFLKLDNNYDDIKKWEFQCGSRPSSELEGGERETVHGDGHLVQKIQPVYFFLSCGTSRERALILVRKILMFRCRLVAWLEQDFNNHAISTLIQQRYWAETLAAEKVGDHAEQDFVECMRCILSEENCNFAFNDMVMDESGQEKPSFEQCEDDGLPNGHSEEELIALRHWYLMRAYVNLRISRMYRTSAQESSHLGTPLTPEETAHRMEQYYKQLFQKAGMDSAYSLRNVFFAQIELGSTRRGYLEQIMKTVTFTVGGVRDYRDGDCLESRMRVLEEQWRGYRFVEFEKNGTGYRYRSEYLAVIFMDCCVSALKAGESWRNYSSGYMVFSNLSSRPAKEKCEIRIFREPGGESFDYLVIENDVYVSDNHPHKSGPGMSQTAMHWYIETLWKFITGEEEKYPKVITPTDGARRQYQIKLPVLKKEEGNLRLI